MMEIGGSWERSEENGPASASLKFDRGNGAVSVSSGNCARSWLINLPEKTASYSMLVLVPFKRGEKVWREFHIEFSRPKE